MIENLGEFKQFETGQFQTLSFHGRQFKAIGGGLSIFAVNFDVKLI